MRALVTGGAGFLGSHIVDGLLARGDEVKILDHRVAGKCLSAATLRRVHIVEADITDKAAVQTAAAGCNAIFHCAAIVGVDQYAKQPARTMEVEEVGLRNVCTAARDNGKIKVIYASSSAVYGNTASTSTITETAQCAPTSNYGIAKRFAELYLAAQRTEFGLPSSALRIFNMYGPRQDQRLVVPRFIAQARSGEGIVIYGEGRQSRDFVYVGDVVDAALACAETDDSYEIVNVCSGHETTIVSLAELIIRLTGSSSRIEMHSVPTSRGAFEVDRSVGDRTKLSRLLDAARPVSLDDGLRATIAAWPGMAAAVSKHSAS